MKDTTKLFPNDGEIFFDRTFARIRQPKHPFVLPQQAKDNLEQSIKRGKVVLKCNSCLNTALNDFGNGIGSNDENKAKKQP